MRAVFPLVNLCFRQLIQSRPIVSEGPDGVIDVRCTRKRMSSELHSGNMTPESGPLTSFETLKALGTVLVVLQA